MVPQGKEAKQTHQPLGWTCRSQAHHHQFDHTIDFSDEDMPGPKDSSPKRKKRKSPIRKEPRSKGSNWRKGKAKATSNDELFSSSKDSSTKDADEDKKDFDYTDNDNPEEQKEKEDESKDDTSTKILQGKSTKRIGGKFAV